MRRKRMGALIIGMVYIVFLVLAPLALAQNGAEPGTATPDQEKKERQWTGKRADGSVITRAEFDEILRLHSLWVETDGENGRRANLIEADLHGAFLNEAGLRAAYLRRADLRGADLRGPTLAEPTLAEPVFGTSTLAGPTSTGPTLAGPGFSGPTFAGSALAGPI